MNGNERQALSKNEQLVFIRGNQPFTTSRKVASLFEKEHRGVLRDIRELGCSEQFSLHNFVQREFKNERGQTFNEYLLTKNGFVILVMGYTGEKAMSFK